VTSAPAPAKTWTHEALTTDLALARDTVLWNVPLGSVQLSFAQLVDVMEIKPSYTRFCLTVYEVKVSRADFLADVRAGKWRGYLPHCQRIYFACPAGMLDKREIPAEAGLIVRGPSGWQFKKSAPVRDVEVPADTLLSVAFLRNRKTARERALAEIKAIDGNYPTRRSDYGKGREERIAKRFGENLARAWAERESYKQKREALKGLIESIQYDLREALGVEAKYPEWELRMLIRQIRDKAKAMGIEMKGEVAL
jgi:hypothetical protein